MSRCYNPSNKKYPLYGGKTPPVTVCKEWYDVRTYAKWLMSQPHWDEKGYSVDRVDGKGSYCPENCRVADDKTQNRNTSRNVLIRGRCMSEWAEVLGCDRHAFALYAKYHKCSLKKLDHYIAKQSGIRLRGGSCNIKRRESRQGSLIHKERVRCRRYSKLMRSHKRVWHLLQVLRPSNPIAYVKALASQIPQTLKT